MTWINHEYFTERWLERAERDEGRDFVDIVDKFISLWISFNSWMRGEFGESITNRRLIEKAKQSEKLKRSFEELKKGSEPFKNNLGAIGSYTVTDMRGIEPDESYDDTFSKLIEVIYRVRCNLIHGRKDPAQYEKDLELVKLSYAILFPLLTSIVKGT